VRRVLVALPLALFVFIALSFAFGLRKDPSIIPSVLIEKSLPHFDLPPVRAADTGVRSADLRGEPMLLNLFASWCVTCRIEHPVLLSLRRQGILVVGIDFEDSPAAGAKYLRENGDPYYKVGNDRSGRTGIDLGVTGVPETFVVDKQGRVRYKQIGPIDPDVWTNTIKPLMDQLRSEP
jgi:cytochrome c biogenesis protein CcmG, thiol:disulfide interchange protein DsbE